MSVASFIAPILTAALLIAQRAGAADPPGDLMHEKTTEFAVAVHATSPHVLGDGSGLHALRVTGTALTPVPIEIPYFDFDGNTTVPLTAGKYVLEMYNGTKTVLTAVRTPPFTVTAAAQVQLETSQVRRLRADLDGTELVLDDVAIRKNAPSGGLEWARELPADPPPDLVLSPGQTYAIHVFAHALTKNGPVAVAVWRPLVVPPLKPGAATQADADAPAIVVPLHLRASELKPYTFKIRPGTPPLASATAYMIFPDGTLPVEVQPTTRLLTDRAFALMDYKLVTKTGKTLWFDRMPYPLNRVREFDLGGKLHPSAWASDVWQDDDSVHLCWGASVNDDGGHELGTRSEVDWKAEAQLDDHEWTTETPMAGVDGKQVKEPAKHVKVRLSYDPGTGPVTLALQPTDLVTVHDAKFDVRVPPAWRYRAMMYLVKLDRMNAIEKKLTKRPGPGLVHVTWRLNWNNAVATVGDPRGGGQGLAMSMPISNLDKMDPFDQPQFIEHEMLHNFGYNHGPEMSQRAGEADAAFEQVRWYAVDHPEWTP